MLCKNSSFFKKVFMKKCFYLVLFCWLSQTVFSQHVLSGKVYDFNTGAILPSVSIYINNSSKGTTTNTNGEFVLDNISVSNFDIVASCVGYETFSVSITKDNLLTEFNIKLKSKSVELQSLILQAYEKDGWNKWGRVFTESFIGLKHGITNCEIKNYKTIKFVYNKKAQTLAAYADEPLIIVNKDLGYEVKYDLQNFLRNFKTGLIFYEGYPFFTNIDAREKKVRKWKAARLIAYNGSVLHFMRSIYRNKLQQEGFEIKVLVRYPNKEKERVKRIYKNLMVKKEGILEIIQNDSTAYYSSIIKQSDSLDYIYPNAIQPDSVAYLIDKTAVGLGFNNHLQVTYNALQDYANKMASNNSQKQVSIISIINDGEISIFSNGSYYNPSNFFTEGYWAYSEKLNNLLPVDYEVGD